MNSCRRSTFESFQGAPDAGGDPIPRENHTQRTDEERLEVRGGKPRCLHSLFSSQLLSQRPLRMLFCIPSVLAKGFELRLVGKPSRQNNWFFTGCRESPCQDQFYSIGTVKASPAGLAKRCGNGSENLNAEGAENKERIAEGLVSGLPTHVIPRRCRCPGGDRRPALRAAAGYSIRPLGHKESLRVLAATTP
jgi:hypothetical protein